ncbi:twin-arginine translocation signal domain-containing protein [Methyloterricola oryzae]|uniref:twin-arginine translocation signal domain-containing protein n=1 Tax=Methyloterricola oryzae TaxID=1495050 RepID=UPI000AF8616E|nr:twin-arginine translocation signal domain-containing protein [Methyloterricola oryzae]
MNNFSRRDVLKLSGAALGTMTIGPELTQANWCDAFPPLGGCDQNWYFKALAPFLPGEPLPKGEIRISFMGSSPVLRRARAGASVFVELGNGSNEQGEYDEAYNDCFVFDCGAGSSINYGAMAVQMSKMRKVFLTHLHGDHMNDLTQIYCFGPQQDAKSPLYVWGPSRPMVCDPDTGEQHEDGTLDFARHFREMNRWHTASQSFVGTRWNDAEGAGYDLFVTELNSKNYAHLSRDPWVAYHDRHRKVNISFFPAVHDRNGSISYKLEWNRMD